MPEKFRRVVSTSDYIKFFQQIFLTTTKNYAEDHPEVVSAALAGYQEPAEWIHVHIEEAGAPYSAHTDLPKGLRSRPSAGPRSSTPVGERPA